MVVIVMGSEAPVRAPAALEAIAASASASAAACHARMSVVFVDVAKWFSTSTSHVVAVAMVRLTICGVHSHVVSVECE